MSSRSHDIRDDIPGLIAASAFILIYVLYSALSKDTFSFPIYRIIIISHIILFLLVLMRDKNVAEPKTRIGRIIICILFSLVVNSMSSFYNFSILMDGYKSLEYSFIYSLVYHLSIFGLVMALTELVKLGISFKKGDTDV